MCGTASTFLYDATDENRRISADRFAYWECASCHTVFLAKPPADIGRYYEGGYYDIPTIDRMRTLARKSPSKIETVQRHARGGRLLEIGPAFGVFAFQAKEVGFEVDVIEMDAACCEYLKNTLGVNVLNSDAPHRDMQQLGRHDVIAIWHVMEHLPDPRAFLEAAATNLNPGGVLVIAMPNPDAFQFHVMGRHWPHLDAPRHLALIPVGILTEMAAGLGLKRSYLTSDDSDARSWNRFGWQRFLMNRFSGKLMQRAMFILGYALSVLMSPWDRRGFKGSAYTVVFIKEPTP